MKRITYILISLMSLCYLSSCYDDSSTLATNNIGNISFTKEEENNVYIGSMEELKITPDVQIDEGTNTAALNYEWALTETTESKITNNEFEVICTEPELQYNVIRPISNSPYTLKLTITDTSHNNLQYIRYWNVYVQSSFLDGLLISDTQDGNTSDLTLINNRSFTLNYNKSEQIFRNILTNLNNKPYDGLMQTIAYEVMGYGSALKINQIWAICSDGSLSRFNCLSYTQNGQFSDQSLIIDKPAGLKVLSAFQSYQNFYINTSIGLYTLTPSTTNRFSSPHGAISQNRANNNVIAYCPNTSYTSNSLSGANFQNTTFYDKEKAAFITCDGSGQFMQVNQFKANDNFDPNKFANQTAMSAVVYEDMSQIIFLMKDDISGNYSIYTFSRASNNDGYYDPENEDIWIETIPAKDPSAKDKFTIPTEGATLLNKAISIFFSNRNQVLYVVTPDGIYTINYGSGSTASVSTVAKYTPNSGEKITKAKMYQQGIYNYNYNLIIGETPTIKQTEWNNNAIIVTTQSSEYKGKVYIIPISQVAAGTLDPSKALTYEGFGKILDVTTTGY